MYGKNIEWKTGIERDIRNDYDEWQSQQALEAAWDEHLAETYVDPAERDYDDQLTLPPDPSVVETYQAIKARNS